MLSKNRAEIHEVFPRIYMSGYGPAEDYATIKSLKITHVRSVVPAARAHFASKGVKYLIFDDIQDDSEPNVLKYFERANAFVHDAITANTTNHVLIHCAAGISRSATFCCAYMIQHGNLSLNPALEQGRKKRS